MAPAKRRGHQRNCPAQPLKRHNDRSWWARRAGARINKVLTGAAGFSFQAGNSVSTVSAVAYDLRRTAGYLVADRRGRVIGRVECPMYGTHPEEPDALAVRSGFLSRRRRLVPAEAIDQIDGRSGVIGLSVDGDAIRSFL